MTFTTSDWGTAQTVTVKAGEDNNADDEEETLGDADTPAAGGGYASVAKSLPVTVEDNDTAAVVNCNTAIWCADVEFRTTSALNEMRFLAIDFSQSLDGEFDYNGVTYMFNGLDASPYGHNIPINASPNPPYAIPERTKFSLRLLNMNASGDDPNRFQMPNEDWLDWALHVSTTKEGETLTAALSFSEARFSAHYWQWFGSDLEALRAAWTEGQVYKLKIVEDARADRTPQVLGPPLYVEVRQTGNYRLGVRWKMPETRDDRLHPNTSYKVQWKEASDSWDNPADVSEVTDSPNPAQGEVSGHVIKGLTGGVEYHVRVIATNLVGDSEPSEVVSGTPAPLQSADQSEVVVNSPTEGAPAITGTAEVGQTLTADTTDITDADGLQDVTFTYQWLADDAEIEGATNSIYTLASGDEGKAIKVKVDFTDDAGNSESLTSAPTTAVGTAAPQLQSATVDGSTLTLTFDEDLDVGVSLSTTAFAVNVNEESRSLIAVGVGTDTVLLSLSTAVESGDTVTVDYTKPSGANVIKDTSGNAADSFSAQAVTNNTASTGIDKSDPVQSPASLTVNRHESGKLRASWDAPASGPTPTGYTVQWKESGDDWATAADLSKSNVKGTSHVITGLTDGTAYSVRVMALKGDDDSDPSGGGNRHAAGDGRAHSLFGRGGRALADHHLQRGAGHCRGTGQVRLRRQRGWKQPGRGVGIRVGQRGDPHPRDGGVLRGRGGCGLHGVVG